MWIKYTLFLVCIYFLKCANFRIINTTTDKQLICRNLNHEKTAVSIQTITIGLDKNDGLDTVNRPNKNVGCKNKYCKIIASQRNHYKIMK